MRTHPCTNLTPADTGTTVTLAGWVASRRDHGGVIFIDLRDNSGIVQVVADPQEKNMAPAAFTVADAARNEFVLRVTGTVRRRPDGTDNPDLATGTIEVVAEKIELLNRAEPLPFQLDDADISEPVRLKYRFLDLRRPAMQTALRLRHRLIKNIRGFLDANDFVEIETPILTRSTPEGARDYLVPSRTHPGQFFALPQSPQLFKQLIMVGGFERYYQIARCFRDEDLRSDRQAEFTQLDVEMSFVGEEQVMALMEKMIVEIFSAVAGVKLPSPLPRLSHTDALLKYGSDRPDLRVDLQLTELTDLMKEVEFKVFNKPATDPDGRVAALKIPGGGKLTRAQIDAYTEFVKTFGAGGLAWIKVNTADDLQSPIVKFLTDDALAGILKRTAAAAGDLIFFGADRAAVVNDALGALRVKVADDLRLVADGWRPLWVVDFPLFAWDADAKRWDAQHHPFTAPRDDDIALLDTDPGKVRSRAYDLVLNGAEIGGGSVRIHNAELQRRVLNVLGVGDDEAQAQFGFLLDALTYGAPPHGGIAFGIDRIAALIAGADSIRDVIAFPKTQRASCLLTDAPSAVSAKQLKELNLKPAVRKPSG